MKLIRVSAAVEGEAATEELYRGKKFTEADLDFVATEDTTVLKPDGTPLFILVKRCLPASAIRKSYPVLREFYDPPKNRQTATIGHSATYSRTDGLVSRTNMISTRDVPAIRAMSSVIIGFYDRSTRMPFCRATAFNVHHPEEFAKCLPLFQAVDAVFKKHTPAQYAVQEARTREVNPAWIIPGTTFSTVTVNRNYPCAVHKDAGDFKGGFGVMSAMRSGDYEGGVTYWPGYRAGALMDTGDVLLADVHEWHGVTDIRGAAGRYERVSLVFYQREKMCQCKSPAEELEIAKNRKLGDQLYDEDGP